ncbi:MAG: helix-turn-helix transcriptional regulator [Clostridia bacterium]|nr:helix-turn-helix transcriptional regulator [Clostridia bacterium]
MANDNSISSDLIRGHIDTIILRSLYDGDKNGNEICLDIDDKSGGQYEIKQPTLYSALKRLETSGFVKSYWASGDVGRRRYYKLTDDGKQICEDNFNSWIHSRNIIDKLISDGKNLGYPEYVRRENKSEYTDTEEEFTSDEVQPKFDVSDYENYTFTPPSDVSDEDEKSVENTESFFDSLNFEPTEDEPVLKYSDDSDYESKVIAKKNERNLNDFLSSDADEFSVTQLSLIEESETADNVEETAEENDVLSEKTSVGLNENINTTKKTAGYVDDEDDYLEYERYNAPEKMYSDILSSLYPSPVKEIYREQTVNYVDETEEEDVSPARVFSPEEHEVKTSAITVDTQRSEPERQPEEKKEAVKENKSTSEIDYSDIINVANEHGFRVKTADRTNHADRGSLYINKLISLASTVLYVILILELALVCMPLNDVLNFGTSVYLIGFAVLFVFPLITYIIMLFMPNKTVDRLPTMKYSITTSIVVVLNLFLLTFAVTLIMQVDLNDAKNLLKYIIIPFVIYLNIPLYYIIKYSLVSGKVFFVNK